MSPSECRFFANQCASSRPNVTAHFWGGMDIGALVEVCFPDRRVDHRLGQIAGIRRNSHAMLNGAIVHLTKPYQLEPARIEH